MEPLRPESTTLPRGFRFHCQDGRRPKTPEPLSTGDLSQPTPPRVPKLKIRRRNVLELDFIAPTEQFLASVAAADMPIPTIEEPEILADQSMLDQEYTSQSDLCFLAPPYRSSPPKTPVPQLVTMTDEHSNHRPDWSMSIASTPDDAHTRPSSALSNPSDWSDDSYFSSIRTSRPSDDGSCTSSESEAAEPFVFPPASRRKAKIADSSSETAQCPDTMNGQVQTKAHRNTFWTKDMSDHLWQTYQLYLQDPTVTPFRVGTSSIPPEGVINRVAREAKRSWKGPKAASDYHRGHRRAQSSRIDVALNTIDLEGSPRSTDTGKSGSNTPTTEFVSKTYLEWHHSSAATRNHLRELCKRKAAASIQTHRFFQSRGPSPVTENKSRQCHRPSQSASFSTRDIAFALTSSTSDSMQSDGPLANLAESSNLVTSVPLSPEELREQKNPELRNSIRQGIRSTRLGSPFSSHTYGPSSSRSLGAFSRPLQSDETHNFSPLLGSPVNFGQSLSKNGTQKRRAHESLDEESGPSIEGSRPTILNERLFGTPFSNSQRRVRSRGFSLGDEAARVRIPGLFVPAHLNMDGALEVGNVDQSHSSSGMPSLLPSATFDFPGTQHSYNASGAGNTFPRRLFHPLDGPCTSIRKRQYATVHHIRHSINSFDFDTAASLQSKLSLLDNKLAEIHNREEASRKGMRD